MALSMDEQRELAEIERRLAEDDPVLAARLTAFRVPRLSLGPRSPRARLAASIGMLVVVAVVSVFVYAMMPFRGLTARDPGTRPATTAAAPTVTILGKGPAIHVPGRTAGLAPRAPSSSPDISAAGVVYGK
jgi:Protein of unknown function (DUF3040)